jgi:hypothetical protein
MIRAAATLASGRNRGGPFEARTPVRLVVVPGSASPGTESMVGAKTHEALIFLMTAAFVTLWVEASLKFQKYRFDNGLMLGITLAAVNWFKDVARRKNLRPSRLTTLILIATIAAAFTVALQQAARVLAAGLPPSITHS